MPTGAMKVDLCFSIASIRIVNTSSEVIKASMKTPCASEVPSERVVRTFNGVGNIARTRAEAVMLPTICERNRQIARVAPTAPVAHNAKVTCLYIRLNRWIATVSCTYCWVEQATGYPEEDPYIDHETESKGDRYVEHHNRTESHCSIGCC